MMVFQAFHKSDKKIVVRLPFDQAPMYAQIGAYTLQPPAPDAKTLTIGHMEYN